MPPPQENASIGILPSPSNQPIETRILPTIIEFPPNESINSTRTTCMSPSTSVIPSTNLEFLRSVHKRIRRKRKLRKFLRCLHCIFVYILPIGGILLGIVGILVGHFHHVESIFISGCLLLITAFGLALQSCFWRRSLPNKFHAKEIAFNMAPDDSLLSKSNEPSNQEVVENSTTPPRESITPNKSVGINSAQVRRLSMALNRATAELSAARQINSDNSARNGILNLARRLTMAPMHFGDYGNMPELQSSNGWISGQYSQGVRRGLAWNDTGASRFYASNYD